MLTSTLKTVGCITLTILITSCNIIKRSGQRPPANITITNIAVPDVEQPVVYSLVQNKYAQLLKVEPASIRNLRLYGFIEKWWNTPYKWGGNSETGIDCSAFLQRLLLEVYEIKIPRTSLEQFNHENIEAFSSVRFLEEGDLIFFKTIKNTRVSHVGLYLQNNMFINCSSSAGVSLASLDNPYWKNGYVACGRIRASLSTIHSK